MIVSSSYNQNISLTHLASGFKGLFKDYSDENSQLLASLLNIPTNLHFTWYHDARSAFYNILCNLKLQTPGKTTVVLPAHTCVVLVNAVLKAKLKIKFIDTQKNSTNYDAASLRSNLNTEVLAILIPANFGEGIDQQLVDELKLNYNLILDCANSLPEFYPDDYFGIILSFGSNKLLDAVHGGVAITSSKISTDLSPQFKRLLYPNPIGILKASFKILVFIAFRKVITFRLVTVFLAILKNLNLFPEIISFDEKNLNYDKVSYRKLSGFFHGTINQTLKSYKKEEYQQKVSLLTSSLASLLPHNYLNQNTYQTCFIPLIVDRPKDLFKLLQKHNVVASLDWSFAQIVPKSANLPQRIFKPGDHPNSYEFSNKLILLPINNSLTLKAISKILHLITDFQHAQKLSNY